MKITKELKSIVIDVNEGADVEIHYVEQEQDMYRVLCCAVAGRGWQRIDTVVVWIASRAVPLSWLH